MNACEAEILEVTKLKKHKSYKNRQAYLAHLMKAVDGLGQDQLDWLISHQTYEWYRKAADQFIARKPMPDLPEVAPESLRYPRDDEPAEPPPNVPTPEEQRGNIKAVLEKQEKAEEALRELAEATEKIKAKRHSKYRLADPSEGARHYLFPEPDRYGLIRGSKRSIAAEMLERGCTMQEVKNATGYTQYNLLKLLRDQGHSVVNAGGIIKLTYKGDLEGE